MRKRLPVRFPGKTEGVKSMNELLLCPSMMCADFDHLADDVKKLDAAGADIFHCDIMDGTYVPNMTLGLQDVRCIRRNTGKPVDAHLMVENPSRLLQLYLDAGCDLIYLHADSDRYVGKALLQIRQAGRKSGLVLNPDESPESARELFPLADYVMLMTVYPGFAGQKYLEHVTDKLKRLMPYKEQYGFKVTIDGACSPEKIRELSAIGADGFILGTSALFGKPGTYAEILRGLRSE